MGPVETPASGCPARRRTGLLAVPGEPSRLRLRGHLRLRFQYEVGGTSPSRGHGVMQKRMLRAARTITRVGDERGCQLLLVWISELIGVRCNERA